MELPKYLHGSQKGLPKTLASRLSYIRNGRKLHIAELSSLAKVPIQQLEDLEAGIETWIPTAVRQRIARVLSIDPQVLEEVEIKTKFDEDFPKDPPLELLERIQEEILLGKNEIKCPLCGNTLKSWVQEGFDLNGKQIKSAKAHCSVCIFQLRG